MTPVAYFSKIRIEHTGIPNNRAILPPVKETVLFGVHDEIAEHYKIAPESYEPHAATLD